MLEDKEEDKEDENPREITYVDENTDVIYCPINIHHGFY
jgi:hypothetical protein